MSAVQVRVPPPLNLTLVRIFLFLSINYNPDFNYKIKSIDRNTSYLSTFLYICIYGIIICRGMLYSIDKLGLIYYINTRM